MMRCPADWTAAQMMRAGNRAFLYHLGVDRDGKIHHGSELAFVMNPRPDGQGDDKWPPLLDYWVNFSKTGDPNAPGLPRWPVFDLERRATMIFDNPCRVVNDPRGNERRLFAQVPYVQPGT